MNDICVTHGTLLDSDESCPKCLEESNKQVLQFNGKTFRYGRKKLGFESLWDLKIAVQFSGRTLDSYPSRQKFNSSHRNTRWLQPNGRAEACGASCESSILSSHTTSCETKISCETNLRQRRIQQKLMRPSHNIGVGAQGSYT